MFGRRRRNEYEYKYGYYAREKRSMRSRKALWKRIAVSLAGLVCVVGMVIFAISVIQKNPFKDKFTQFLHRNDTELTERADDVELGSNHTENRLETTEEQGEMESETLQAELPVYQFTSTPNTVTISNEEIISSNIILVEESTDTIIAERGAMERISPASMTKVLTILVAAEHISPEQLDDTFTITFDITDYVYVNDCSCVGFDRDEVVTVRDLFYGTILPSGGDAAVGLATYVAGSHEAFVDMMNEKLEELGLSDSAHFTNCVGLYDENHYCSVYDMAIIMKAALQNEFCKEILSTRIYTTTPTEQHPEGLTISNWFIRRIEDKDNESGGAVLGGKTGYVVQSKNCAVSYGIFGETSYICVAAGSSSSWRCIYDHVDIYTQYVPKGQVE